MNFDYVAPKSKVDDGGRVYIPKDIRNTLEICTGEEVEVLVNRNEKAILIKLINESGDNHEKK